MTSDVQDKISGVVSAFREGERRGFLDGFCKGACVAAAGVLLVWYLVASGAW